VPNVGLAQAMLGQPKVDGKRLGSPPLGLGTPLLASHFEGASIGEKKLSLPLRAPSPEQLFHVESEATLRQRLEEEYRALGQQTVLFPKDAPAPAPGPVAYYPQAAATLEVPGLRYGTRYFHDEEPERYGIYYPCVQPLLSTSRFYFQTLCLPIKMALSPPWLAGGGEGVGCPD
jgi:hypothetical protein